jgi:hypothetical protein
MALDIGALAQSILGAFRGVLDQKWPTIKDYASGEATKLAHTLAQIETLKATNQISEAEASVLLQMQKNSTRSVLLTVEGMGLLLVEQAINAALDAVRGAVNTALGFALL